MASRPRHLLATLTPSLGPTMPTHLSTRVRVVNLSLRVSRPALRRDLMGLADALVVILLILTTLTPQYHRPRREDAEVDVVDVAIEGVLQRLLCR